MVKSGIFYTFIPGCGRYSFYRIVYLECSQLSLKNWCKDRHLSSRSANQLGHHQSTYYNFYCILNFLYELVSSQILLNVSANSEHPQIILELFITHWVYRIGLSLEELTEKYLERTPGHTHSFVCSLCAKPFHDKTSGKFHLEAKHFPSEGYFCIVCGKHLKTQNSLKCHLYQTHTKEQRDAAKRQ